MRVPLPALNTAGERLGSALPHEGERGRLTRPPRPCRHGGTYLCDPDGRTTELSELTSCRLPLKPWAEKPHRRGSCTRGAPCCQISGGSGTALPRRYTHDCLPTPSAVPSVVAAARGRPCGDDADGLLAFAAGKMTAISSEEIASFREMKDKGFASNGSPVPEDRADCCPSPISRSRLNTGCPRCSRLTRTGRRWRCRRRPGNCEPWFGSGASISRSGAAAGLSAFVEAGARDLDQLFVPFTDLTSGTETYPAGRYLDFERHEPGCTSSTSTAPTTRSATTTPPYDCPYLPRENRLQSRYAAASA